MNLGFWIAWFQYQKLKIFPFEYLVLKAGIPSREKDFCPSSQDWFEGFFLDQGLNRNVLNRGIELKKDIESWRGGLIIINNRILPHRIRKIRPCSCTLQLISFLFSLLFFLYHHTWFSFIITRIRTESKCAKSRDWIEEGHWKLEGGLDHYK